LRVPPAIDVHAQFVVAPVEILHEGMFRAHYPGGAQPFETAYLPQWGFQASVIRLDQIVRRTGTARPVVAVRRFPNPQRIGVAYGRVHAADRPAVWPMPRSALRAILVERAVRHEPGA